MLITGCYPLWAADNQPRGWGVGGELSLRLCLQLLLGSHKTQSVGTYIILGPVQPRTQRIPVF